MEILADYHTHTVYSHGKGSIEDNVKVAISKGIKKIGISDHGYKNVAYGVKIDDFEKMRERRQRGRLRWRFLYNITIVFLILQRSVHVP